MYTVMITTALVFFFFIQLAPSFSFRRYQETPIQFLFIFYACIAIAHRNAGKLPLTTVQNVVSILFAALSSIAIIIYFYFLFGKTIFSRQVVIFSVLEAAWLAIGMTVFFICHNTRFFYCGFSLFTLSFLVCALFCLIKTWRNTTVEKKILLISTCFMVMMFLGISVFYALELAQVQYFFVGTIVYFFGYEFFLCVTALQQWRTASNKQSSSKEIQSFTFNESEMKILKVLMEHPNVPYKQLEESAGLSRKTISNYLTSIYRQLKVANKKQLQVLLKENATLRTFISSQEPS